MNTEQKINNSYVYAGSGAYQHLAPVITPKGRAAGWIYHYPVGINLNGVNFSKITTLDDMIAGGLVELKQRATTCC